MKFIIGKKLEMAKRFTTEGIDIPVTRISAGPCLVMAKKDLPKFGYRAVLLVSDAVSEKKIDKAQKGNFQKAFGAITGYKNMQEFRLQSKDPVFDKLEIGQAIDVSIFVPGDMVNIQGKSKGRGFQGVVKRHHFAGGKKSHGHKDQLRMPGSIGATGPGHVFKGRRMAGHMGFENATLKNLEVIEVNPEKNEILVKGAVPGGRGNLLFIEANGDFEPKAKQSKQESEISEVSQQRAKEDTVPVVEKK